MSINPEDILRIRTSKESVRKLAARYGVSATTIANIKAGRTHINPHHCPYCKQVLQNHPPVIE